MRYLALLSILLALPVHAATAPASPPEPSLLSFSSGALVVQAPQEYGSGWSALWMFDEKPGTGWATPEGVVTPQATVLALPERTTLKRLELDTGSIDGDFHLRQQGNAISGCYEHDDGLIVNGGIEGRVLSFTWREEGPSQGPAVMVFAPDGKQFFGRAQNRRVELAKR